MTAQNNPFKWVLSLEHIGKVKSVEMLWRNSAAKQEIKSFNATSRPYNYLLKPIIEHLGEAVERLRVPEVMKHELKLFVIPMVSSALSWLGAIIHLHDGRKELFTHCIDNFSWDSSGCIDGKTMLESYVINKKTIDFHTWRLLCDYCIENYIRSFAKTIDWKNCRDFTNSPHCIYWYWKIFEEFPAKDMFSSDLEYSEFDMSWNSGDDIVQKMLQKSATNLHYSAGISAIKYFRHQLKDETKFRKLYSTPIILEARPSMKFYLLEQVEDESWLEPIRDLQVLYDCLVAWPWILFTGYWKEVLKGKRVLSCHFIGLFGAITTTIIHWKMQGLRERDYGVLWDKTVYHPFQDLWTVFSQRFGSDKVAVPTIFYDIFSQRNITLCKIMFKGAEHSQREHFLKVLEDLTQNLVLDALSDTAFCTQFIEEVIVSDIERGLFQRIVDNRRQMW